MCPYSHGVHAKTRMLDVLEKPKPDWHKNGLLGVYMPGHVALVVLPQKDAAECGCLHTYGEWRPRRRQRQNSAASVRAVAIAIKTIEFGVARFSHVFMHGSIRHIWLSYVPWTYAQCQPGFGGGHQPNLIVLTSEVVVNGVLFAPENALHAWKTCMFPWNQ